MRCPLLFFFVSVLIVDGFCIAFPRAPERISNGPVRRTTGQHFERGHDQLLSAPGIETEAGVVGGLLDGGEVLRRDLNV